MFGLIRKKREDKMGDFNLCPKCGGVPTFQLVGDNRNLIIAICSKCGYCAARPGEARNTEKGALKIWNKRTSEISHILLKLKQSWIVKGDYLVCPQCKVAQKKVKETEPTPFCPICGAWLTNETAKEWISKNTVASKVHTEERSKT